MKSNNKVIGWLNLTLLEIIEEYKGGSNEPLDGDDTQRLAEIIQAKIDLQEGNITEAEYDSIIDNTSVNSNITYLFIDLNIREGERVHNHRVLTQTTNPNIEEVVNNYASEYWGESEKENDNTWFACGGEIAIEVFKYRVLDKKTYDTMNEVFYGA